VGVTTPYQTSTDTTPARKGRDILSLVRIGSLLPTSSSVDAARVGWGKSWFGKFCPDLTLSDTIVVWGWSTEEPRYRLVRVEV